MPVISVVNPSLLSVTADALGICGGVHRAASYAEAAGLVLALREGVAPGSLGRPLPGLETLN